MCCHRQLEDLITLSLRRGRLSSLERLLIPKGRWCIYSDVCFFAAFYKSQLPGWSASSQQSIADNRLYGFAAESNHELRWWCGWFVAVPINFGKYYLCVADCRVHIISETCEHTTWGADKFVGDIVIISVFFVAVCQKGKKYMSQNKPFHGSL